MTFSPLSKTSTQLSTTSLGRQLQSVACAVLFLFVVLASPALAAPLDKSANSKIDEAINVHYLATNFRKAEGLLKGTINACGQKCSAEVVGRAWMYIGVIRGSGNQDLTGAAKAFDQAIAADPSVKLDTDLATDEVRDAFTAAKAKAGVNTEEPVSLEAETEEVQLEEETADAAPLPGGMNCTPNVTEVQTRRPIPVACTTDQPATKAILYYAAFGAPSFSRINMGLKGDSWLGQIPCTGTDLQGTLQWYVVAQDSTGKTLDSFGVERMPMEVEVVDSTTIPPPAYPGSVAPARCSDAGDCPPEMRGTPSCPAIDESSRGNKSWGAACGSSSECESGLYCLDSTCQSPPSCETDADCSSGTCDGFVCSIDESSTSSAASGDAPKNLVSVKLGWDLAALSGEDVCNPLSDSSFVCFVGSERYFLPESAIRDPDNPAYEPTQGGSFGSSLVPGTVRIAASYERIFANKFGAEAQLGLGLGGAPNTDTIALLHIAAYGKYWFSGTGPGLKLYALLGGGLGQVDAGKDVTVAEVGDEPRTEFCEDLATDFCTVNVTAYRKLGTSFIAAGGGAFLNLGGHGPSLDLQGKILLPASGFVLQPTLGYLLGF